MRELFLMLKILLDLVTARKKSNFRPQASKQAETSSVSNILSGVGPETLVCEQLSLYLWGLNWQLKQNK